MDNTPSDAFFETWCTTTHNSYYSNITAP